MKTPIFAGSPGRAVSLSKMHLMKKAGFPGIAAVAVFLVVSPAFADLDLDWGMFVDNDLRAAVDRVDEPAFIRNQTTRGLDVDVMLVPDKLRVVGDVRLVWTGFARDTEFEGLTQRNTVSPYYFESQAAFLEVFQLLPWLDVRVGRQIVSWGAADVFNPTSNLNSLDLEDPLMIGERVANEMIKIDFNPGGGDFIFTGVVVPVFQPSQLPGSALLAVGDPESEFPFFDAELRMRGEQIRNIYLRNPDYYNILQPDVSVQMPGFQLENVQAAARIQWLIGMFDMSLSYYYGRDSIPVPVKSNSTAAPSGEVVNGTPVLDVGTQVSLVYPRKHVLGFDVAGQVPFLDDAGIWFEGSVTFPEQIEMELDLTAVAPGAEVLIGDTVSSEPFFKFTVGMDYTINEHLFVIAQFMRGFIDEFGAGNINNYWMVSGDVKGFQERLLVRLVVFGELPHEDRDRNLDDDGDGMVESFAPGATRDGTIAALVLFPSVTVKPVDGLELALGSYFLLGHSESKLAMPAAGPSLAFFRARASF